MSKEMFFKKKKNIFHFIAPLLDLGSRSSNNFKIIDFSFWGKLYEFLEHKFFGWILERDLLLTYYYLGRQLRLSIFAVRIPLCYKSDSIILMYHTIHHDGQIKSAINKCLQKILNRLGVERWVNLELRTITHFVMYPRLGIQTQVKCSRILELTLVQFCIL